MLTASCLLRMRCSDDAEKRKNAPQVFPGFPIIKLARHCGKITIFFKKCAFYGNGFRSGGMFRYKIYGHLGLKLWFTKNDAEFRQTKTIRTVMETLTDQQTDLFSACGPNVKAYTILPVSRCCCRNAAENPKIQSLTLKKA